jgi:hypothetical protein
MNYTLNGEIDQVLSQFSQDEREELFFALSLSQEILDEIQNDLEIECAEECFGSFDFQF